MKNEDEGAVFVVAEEIRGEGGELGEHDGALGLVGAVSGHCDSICFLARTHSGTLGTR